MVRFASKSSRTVALQIGRASGERSFVLPTVDPKAGPPESEVSAENLHGPLVETLSDLASLADYSFLDSLNRDPDAEPGGANHTPRQVYSGHYVPVSPTPIETPEYVTHSKTFFRELGFADSLARSADFVRMFSSDLSSVPEPMRKVGWSTGYALSIYGTEYIQQCPFQTGNGYGDGTVSPYRLRRAA